jgi:hypothetical protein
MSRSSGYLRFLKRCAIEWIMFNVNARIVAGTKKARDKIHAEAISYRKVSKNNHGTLASTTLSKIKPIT